MRPSNSPYRNEAQRKPRVIAIAATRKHIWHTLSWNLALAGLLYALCLGLSQ